jgi:hypothetical protein
MVEAEDLTRIKNWQVSRWRTKLANEDAYRNAIIEAAHDTCQFLTLVRSMEEAEQSANSCRTALFERRGG